MASANSNLPLWNAECESGRQHADSLGKSCWTILSPVCEVDPPSPQTPPLATTTSTTSSSSPLPYSPTSSLGGLQEREGGQGRGGTVGLDGELQEKKKKKNGWGPGVEDRVRG